LLEEIFASNHLHIIDGDRARTTFQSSRGSRNVDLSIVNNQMLATIKGCEISEEESCWEYKNITFNLNLACNKAQIYKFLGTLYIIKGQHTEFHKNVLQRISKKFHIKNYEGNFKEIDNILNTSLTGQEYISLFIKKFDGAIDQHARNHLFT
jgi:hypothetical protein